MSTFKNCNNPSCKFWHLPVCLNYKSGEGCVKGDKCRFRHVEEYVKPNKKSKKRWCERISCTTEGVYTVGLWISRFLSEKLYSAWARNVGIETRRQVLQRALGTKLKFGKERVHREVLSKSVHLMSVVLARRNSRTDHMRRPWPKNDAPAKQRRIWRKIFTSSRIRTKLRFMSLVKSKVCRRLLLQRDQKHENS